MRENKPIIDGHYDHSLAVRCVNGTFVGEKSEHVISYKGIPFVAAQPIGDLRWKAPVAYAPDNGVYEACHFEEVPVLFAHPEFVVGRTCSDLFCQTMRALWVQFAKTGNPSLTAEQSPDGKAKIWPLYDLKDKYVMLLDDNDIRPAKEADVHIVDWNRTTFLSKYYML